MVMEKSRTLEPEPRVAEEAVEEADVSGETATVVREGHWPRPDRYVWGLLRLAMGWVFMWTFLDSLFGLGYPTARAGGWLDGKSPTADLLETMPKGPFADFYRSLAGYEAVDWIFMIGFTIVGVTLLLGVAVRFGAVLGALLFMVMYSAVYILPLNNPFLNDHVVYVIIMAGLIFTHAGRHLGLGNWWERTSLVRRYPRVLE